MQYDRPKFGGIGQLVKMSKGDVSGSEMLPRTYVFQENLTVVSPVQNQNSCLNLQLIKGFLRLDPIINMGKRKAGKIKIKRTDSRLSAGSCQPHGKELPR